MKWQMFHDRTGTNRHRKPAAHKELGPLIRSKEIFLQSRPISADFTAISAMRNEWRFAYRQNPVVGQGRWAGLGPHYAASHVTAGQSQPAWRFRAAAGPPDFVGR
jgi:hypothetical protein